jgi:chemotaxis protein MotB
VADDKPIIIIKKKGGHGGAHGGAWKVAYADFVTAMMAFFMVMWLVNSADQKAKANIASYFRKPGIFESGSGTPLLIGEAGILQDGFVPAHPEDTKQRHKGSHAEPLPERSGTDSTDVLKKRVTTEGDPGAIGNREWQQEQLDGFASEPIPEDELNFEPERLNRKPQQVSETAEKQNRVLPGPGGLADKHSPGGKEKSFGEKEKNLADLDGKAAAALKAMQNAAQELQQVIASSPELKEMLGIVDIKVEADGLNIEIMDTDKISMFELGSSRINSVSEAAFQKIGAFIAKLPNNVDIVGHTDAKPFASQRRGGYSNWELSADRANAARRLLEKGGVDPKRFTSVVGRADQELRVPTEPFASSNRRITVKMRFNPALVPAAPPTALEDFSRIENQFRDGQRSIAPAAASPPQAKAAEISPEAAAATAEVLPPNAVVSSNPNQKIKLPREAPPTMNPNIMPRDKIFGDVPGFVPVDPFATP